MDRAEDDGIRIWEGYDEDDTEVHSQETESSLSTQIFEDRKSKVIPQKKRIGRLMELIVGKKEEPSQANV